MDNDIQVSKYLNGASVKVAVYKPGNTLDILKEASRKLLVEITREEKKQKS